MHWRRINTVDLLWNLLLGLTTVFIVAKIAGLIDWPWWAVLSPFAVPLSIAWLIFLGLFVFWFCVILVHRIKQHRRSK